MIFALTNRRCILITTLLLKYQNNDIDFNIQQIFFLYTQRYVKYTLIYVCEIILTKKIHRTRIVDSTDKNVIIVDLDQHLDRWPDSSSRETNARIGFDGLWIGCARWKGRLHAGYMHVPLWDLRSARPWFGSVGILTPGLLLTTTTSPWRGDFLMYAFLCDVAGYLLRELGNRDGDRRFMAFSGRE